MFAFAAGKSQGRSEETRAAERVSVCNGMPGKSFEATLPAWVVYGGRNLKNAWKPSESAGKEVVKWETRVYKKNEKDILNLDGD